MHHGTAHSNSLNHVCYRQQMRLLLLLQTHTVFFSFFIANSVFYDTHRFSFGKGPSQQGLFNERWISIIIVAMREIIMNVMTIIFFFFVFLSLRFHMNHSIDVCVFDLSKNAQQNVRHYICLTWFCHNCYFCVDSIHQNRNPPKIFSLGKFTETTLWKQIFHSLHIFEMEISM